MSTTYQVTFLPSGKSVPATAGTTVLDVSKQAGVLVDSICGGDGVCGRCRVIVRKGKVSGASTEIFTREEVRSGYIQACEGRVESDLIIEVPAESRLQRSEVHEEVPELADLSQSARRSLALDPLIKKTHVAVPPPSLSDNVSDLQRLYHALSRKTAGHDVYMGLKLMRLVPTILRRHDWTVTASAGHRGARTHEIINLEGGDTTQRNLCVAADIGTTTVVCHLVDCVTGQTFGQAAKFNSQAAYGADVIRRILHAAEGPEKELALRQAIVGDLNELIQELAARFHIDIQDVSFLTVAGNTAMVHLLLSLPADHIRRDPYVGTAYRFPPLRAANLGVHINARGLLYCLPCIASFVGADLVAGIYATGMAAAEEPRMLIDIGTNGEIVIGNRDFLVCASASAGPAFEGAECKCGMRATRGAIDHLRLADANHVLSYSTVASARPAGISGTGYVDLIAEMLRTGVIDKTGTIHARVGKDCVHEGDYGDREYEIIPAQHAGYGKAITISQADISNIVRAKGAIYAAADVLLKSLSMSFDDIAELLVAGAFGNFLNLENAVAIGLLPDLPLERMRFVGNAALAGAKLAALSQHAFDEMSRIADRTTYFELSTDPNFMDQFVAACFLPHTNVHLFPSVAASMAGRRNS